MTDDTPDGTPAHTGLEQLRTIDDAQTMRALSHPVRLALLDALEIHGPLTATAAGEWIGESSTTCSFHLRQLHRYGFVEEVGGGKGRARPWRLSHTGLNFSTEQADPETRIAAGTLSRLHRERRLERLQTWQETRDAYAPEWRQAASASEHLLWLTADELRELNADLFQLLINRAPGRREDPGARPDGALPVEILSFSFPIDQSTGGER